MAGMSQLALPLDDPSKRPTPNGAAKGRDARGVSEDDVQSSKEENVQVCAAETQPRAHRRKLESRSRFSSIEPGFGAALWPAALTWSDALKYSSLSPAQMRRWERTGALRFRRLGRNGARVVMRSQLDQLLEAAFAPAPDIEEDFDFG